MKSIKRSILLESDDPIQGLAMAIVYSGLDSWPDKEMRKEYTRLRDIAQKRIKRLSKDPISSTSDIYKEFAGGFPTIKAMRGDRKALEQALADVARFVRAKGSTVGGARV